MSFIRCSMKIYYKIFWKKLREPRTRHNTSALSIYRHNFEHASFIKFPFLSRFINDSFYTFLFSKSCQNFKIKNAFTLLLQQYLYELLFNIHPLYFFTWWWTKNHVSDIYSRSNLNYPLVISFLNLINCKRFKIKIKKKKENFESQTQFRKYSLNHPLSNFFRHSITNQVNSNFVFKC